MKNLFLVSLLTLFAHCAMAQIPADGSLNDYGLLSQKAKVVRQTKYNLKKALPVKDEEIIKDKPAGEEVEEIQRKSICAVPETGGAAFASNLRLSYVCCRQRQESLSIQCAW